MRLGFTGTSAGMNPKQKRDFVARIALLQPTEFHHGDCIGADAESHALIRQHAPTCKIVIHPPDMAGKRAFCKGDDERKPKNYIKRNHAIVDSTEVLIAAPKRDYEELRSGTWATVRYGRRVLGTDKVQILYPI